MSKWIVVCAVIVIGLALIVICFNTWRTKRTFSKIEQMLDLAMEDDFSEKIFDESRMSALETKFAHYLSASVVSAHHVREEKDTIKALISDISHQTKTPIANLLLYTELLEEEPLDEQAKEYVQLLHGQTKKLRFLIDSLVKLSRLENGILSLHPTKQQLQPLLEQLITEFENQAAKKGLMLMLHPTDETACFDEKWTAEAIGNIVDNAIKYTDAGRIEISASAYELYTRIDVKDSGVGISEEEQAKIFSRFYRSEKLAQKEGVGIGLYLARQILAGENGYIRVVSEEGKGATFSVFLPR